MEEVKKELQKKEAKPPEGAERIRARRTFMPDTDILERGNDIVVIADMPGVDEKTVDITLERNTLTIHGNVEPEVKQGYKLTYAEYSVGDYERTFTLSEQIDREKIEATVKNGVLKLILPKAEAVKARKITVKAES